MHYLNLHYFITNIIKYIFEYTSFTYTYNKIVIIKIIIIIQNIYFFTKKYLIVVEKNFYNYVIESHNRKEIFLFQNILAIFFFVYFLH